MAKRTNEKEFVKKLGLKIRRVRSDLGYSAQDFANELQISRAQLYRFEGGEFSPSVATLYRIATLMKVSVSEFLKGLE